jgi:hypothetical protein
MSAQNSRRQYSFIAESTFGVTPATPTMQAFEVITFDPELTAEQLSSQTIRADRQTSFSRRGNKGVEGGMSVEMVADNFDWALEAVMGGTWTGNALKIGNTKRSFAVEEGLVDIGSYRVFNGITFNTLAMSITPENLITAEFGLMGKGTAEWGATVASVLTPITTKSVFFHEEGTISEAGSPSAIMTAISLNLTNNVTGNRVLGNSSYRSMNLGRVQITGQVTALFEDATLYNKFYNSTASTLAFVLSAGTPAETLTFSLPNVKYTAGSIVRADTGPVLAQLDFQADYDTVAGTSLTITRSA